MSLYRLGIIYTVSFLLQFIENKNHGGLATTATNRDVSLSLNEARVDSILSLLKQIGDVVSEMRPLK